MGFKRFLNKEYLKGLAARTNLKMITGVALLIIGVLFFILSVNAMKKVVKANTLSQNMSDFFEHNPDWNPIIKFFGGKLQKKIDYYDNITLAIQIGSVAVTAAGAVLIALSMKKKTTPQNKGEKK